MSEFEQCLDAADWDSVGLVLLASVGDDAAWPSLVRARTKAPILAFEPRKEIREKLSEIDHCYVAETVPEFRSMARGVSDDLFGATILCFSDDTTPEVAEIAAQANRAWQEADVASTQRSLSDVTYAEMRVEALLESIDLLIKYPPLNLLHGHFKDVPAIVVGAGPSLDSQIEALKSHRGLIIAVNSSWPALNAAGIVPDLVIVCEAKPVGKTMASLPMDKVVMGPGMHVGRDTWDLPWKRIAPVLSHEGMFGPWTTALFGVPPAAIGGSAACLGWGVAFLLGCDPIVLVGCDCAPSEAGQLYCENGAFAGTTVYHDERGTHVHKSDAKLAVEDVGGKHRETNEATVETLSYDKSHYIKSVPIYDSLRQWFEESADALAPSGRHFVNASVGGAHIFGFDHITAEEALAGKPSLPPLADKISALLSEYDQGHHVEIGKAIDAQIEGCKKLGDKAAEGVRVVAKLAECFAEINAAGVSLDGLDQKTWHKLEREHCDDGYVPAFEFLASKLSEAKDSHPRTAEAAGLCLEARQIQIAVGEAGAGSDLLDAYVYGQVEASRHKGDRPAVEVFAEIFAEIEKGAAELLPLLRAVKEKVS